MISHLKMSKRFYQGLQNSSLVWGQIPITDTYKWIFLHSFHFEKKIHETGQSLSLISFMCCCSLFRDSRFASSQDLSFARLFSWIGSGKENPPESKRRVATVSHLLAPTGALYVMVPYYTSAARPHTDRLYIWMTFLFDNKNVKFNYTLWVLGRQINLPFECHLGVTGSFESRWRTD